MKRYTYVCFIFIFNSLLSANIVIENAVIWDGESKEEYIGNIFIKDNKIENISNRKFQAERVIDADGLIVTPGLIAPLTEIGIVEIGALSVTRDDNDDFYHIGFSIHDAYNPKSTLIPWNRSNGLVGSITVPSQGNLPIGGMGSFYVLDGLLEISSVEDKVMLGKIGGSNNSSRAMQISLIEDLLSLANESKKIDLDSIDEVNEFIEDSALASKLDFMPRDIRALNKLVNKKITLILNVHRASDILKVIEIKEQYDIDVVISGGQESWMLANKLATASIPVIIDPMNNIPNSFDQLGARSDTAALLEKAGVKVMFTVPRDHNYHLIRQGAGNAVANGMSYNAAINGLSGVVSDVFNIEGRGKLKKGFYADLVIWDGDPLEPASMPTHVIINGEISDLTSRSSRLMERYTSSEDKPNTYR